MTIDWGGIRVGKLRQIDVCLNEQVEYRSVTNGFERYRLPHESLTQTSPGVRTGTDAAKAAAMGGELDFLHAVTEELHKCLRCWAYRMWPDCGG